MIYTNKYNYDKFANMEVKKATISTMTIIDAVQTLPADEQVAGITAAFILLAERYGLEPQDCFVVIKNLMQGADGRTPEFRAVQMYMEKELSDGF